MNSSKSNYHTHPIWNWINWFSFPILLFLALHLLQPEDSASESTFSLPPQSCHQMSGGVYS